jgi:thymidylate kinase
MPHHARLIILDGITGAGKTTAGEIVARRLAARAIPCRFYPELEPGHPLRICGPPIRFETENVKRDYERTTRQLWARFAADRLADDAVTVIESWLFQDTVGWCVGWGRPGLGEARARALFQTIARLIQPLRPALVYFLIDDVRAHLQRTHASRRRPHPHPAALENDARNWAAEQRFVHNIVQSWHVPTHLVRDRHFNWPDDGPFILDAIASPLADPLPNPDFRSP